MTKGQHSIVPGCSRIDLMQVDVRHPCCAAGGSCPVGTVYSDSTLVICI